jgi:hypothetical protein
MAELANIKDLGAIAGAAAALLSTLITAAIGWLKDRGESAKRLSRLEDAGKRVAFVQAWFDTRTRLAPNNTAETQVLALEQLDQIFGEFKSVSLQHAVNAAATAAERRKSIGWLRKALLLYAPVRWRGWVPRAFFYFVILEIVVYPLIEPSADLASFFLGAGIFLAFFWIISRVME